MIMSIRKISYALLALGCFSASASAQPAGGTVYLGGGAGLGTESEFCDYYDGESEDCDDVGFAKKLFVGYRINQHLGFEFSYADILGATGESSVSEDEYSLERYSLDVLGFIPFGNKFTGLGKIGVGSNTFIAESKSNDDDEDDETYEEKTKGLSFGIGASLRLSDAELRVMIEHIYDVDSGLKDSGKSIKTGFSVFGFEAMMHFH